jgi:hypothetical protein
MATLSPRRTVDAAHWRQTAPRETQVRATAAMRACFSIDLVREQSRVGGSPWSSSDATCSRPTSVSARRWQTSCMATAATSRIRFLASAM